MKRALAMILQVMIVILGIAVLVLLLWEPQLEGRNANATQFEIYFKDPFLAYIYLAFVPFFVALYQLFKIVGFAGRGEYFSKHSLLALRIIKYCAMTTGILFIGAVAYLFIFISGKDDIAGGVAIGVFVILACAVIATAAAVLERKLQNAVE